jgi:hypothetical protein
MVDKGMSADRVAQELDIHPNLLHQYEDYLKLKDVLLDYLVD